MKVKSESEVNSVVSDSSQLHGLQPTRLLRPWDFPGKSTVAWLATVPEVTIESDTTEQLHFYALEKEMATSVLA